MSLTKQPKGDFKRVPKSEYPQDNQSTYCDYNEAFIGYDQIRQPHGLENILKILRQSKVPKTFWKVDLVRALILTKSGIMSK